MSDAFEHLTETFNRNVKGHPDIMEPWVIRLDDLENQEDRTQLMRRALRETIKQRYPLGVAA